MLLKWQYIFFFLTHLLIFNNELNACIEKVASAPAKMYMYNSEGKCVFIMKYITYNTPTHAILDLYAPHPQAQCISIQYSTRGVL